MHKLLIKNSRNIHQKALFILVIFLLVLGLIEIGKPMIAEGDAYARALLSQRLMQSNKLVDLNISKLWLPLHFTILSFPNIFNLDLYLWQRVITLILSLGSVVLLFYYTREQGKTISTSLLASILFGFFPLRMVLSTQTLSETVFLFFFIASLCFLFRSEREPKKLIYFSLFFNLSCLIRFEGWFFIPLALLYILFLNKLSTNEKFLYALSVFTLPIWWVLGNFQIYHDLLFFFTAKQTFALHKKIDEYYNLILAYKAWENQLLKIFPLPFLLLSFTRYSFSLKKINVKKIFYFILPLYFYFLLVVQVYFATMEWFPIRYLLIPATFLIPILAEAFIFFLQQLYGLLVTIKKMWLKVALSVLYVGICGLLIFSYKDLYYRSRLNLTIVAFLSLQEISQLNENSTKDLIYLEEIQKYIQSNHQNYNSRLEYYYRDFQRKWHDQALFYMTGISGVDLAKEDLLKHHQKNSLIIWEKEMDQKEQHWQDNFEIVFENENYFLIKLNSI